MKELHICIKKLLLFFCIFIKFSLFSSELVSLCQLKNNKINCKSDYYIVITDAKIGHLPSQDLKLYNKTMWCKKSDSYYRIKFADCVKSVHQIVSTQCTGQQSCDPIVPLSVYFKQDKSICISFDINLYPMSLYVNYDCVPKELFFSPDQINNINFIGGYITSFGYHLLKIANKEEFQALSDFYRNGRIPIERVLRPKLNDQYISIEPLVFQLQIIENSISSNQSNNSKGCQRGVLYSQDYYAFIPINDTQFTNESHQQLSICPKGPNKIGQIFGPIRAHQINITVNVDFTSISWRALLVKFTMILCPVIVVENGDIAYDHIVNVDHQLTVFGVAIITCKDGFFFASSSTNLSYLYTKTIECDHSIGKWKMSNELHVCVKELPTESNKLSTQTTASFQSTNPEMITKIYSKTTHTSFQSSSTANISTIFIKPRSDYITKLLPILITLLILCIAAFLVWKYRDKCKRPRHICYSYCKLHNPTLYYNSHPVAYVNNSGGTYEDLTHNFVWLNPLTDDRSDNDTNKSPTMRDNSIRELNSKYSSYISDIPDEDELPTKEPKTSTLQKLIKSTSTFRNSFTDKFRTLSLPRPISADPDSNQSDDKFSDSKTHLLETKRSHLNPEFKGKTSSARISEIDPSLVIREVDDTYLEPKSNEDHCYGDYMPLSQSDASSTDLTLTGQTSMMTSEDNTYEEDKKKRLSMESNPYYGVLEGMTRNGHPSSTITPNLIRFINFTHSSECVYESIDDDDKYNSHSVKRNIIPLPSPPSDK